MNLAADAEIAQRHLSFLESGRSNPSKTMVLRLGEHLQLPLRDRNSMLLAAGFAPVYDEFDWNDGEVRPVRDMIGLFLERHAPFPSLAFDRHWNIQFANSPVQPLLAGVSKEIMKSPINIVELSLSPDGLAPRIVNFAEWSGHLLRRLDVQMQRTLDPKIAEMIRRARSLGAKNAHASASGPELILPLRLRVGDRTLSFFSTTTIFGSAGEVLLSELTIETFVPADQETSDLLLAQMPVPD
ncbi:MmyB family transcriptional regulator [Cucumibacter marinus]|uniref:MmyB family transcriptional regulator n=1 Tax=Cucumibacter marinus TaxID=1121252 RepID=UPI001FE1CCAC|nr:transcriptional regulator [Cucumibacter marinus]